MFTASAILSLWEGKDECWHPHISPTSSTSCDLQKPPHLLDFSLSPYCKRPRLIQNKVDKCWEPLIHTASHPVFYRTTFHPISGKDIRTVKDLSAPSGWHLQTVLRNEKHRARKEDSMKKKWVWTKVLTLEARESSKLLPILSGSWQAQELRPRASQLQEAHREHLGNAWPSGRDRTCSSHSVCGHVHSWTWCWWLDASGSKFYLDENFPYHPPALPGPQEVCHIIEI